MSTRRTATVTMSAPDASCAAFMIACDGYLPVPTISRDVKVLPAIRSRSSIAICIRIESLPAADEVDDLDFVAFLDDRRIVGRLLDDGEVQFDGDPAGVDLELLPAAR